MYYAGYADANQQGKPEFTIVKPNSGLTPYQWAEYAYRDAHPNKVLQVRQLPMGQYALSDMAGNIVAILFCGSIVDLPEEMREAYEPANH